MLSTTAIRRIAEFDRTIRSKVAMEMSCSLPIPIAERGRLVCRSFYFARSGFPPKTVFDIYPPSWTTEIDWETGQVLSIEAREAAFFGLAGTRFEPFAKFSYREQNERAEAEGLSNVMVRSEAINGLYDGLIGEWRTTTSPPDAAALQFRRLFRSLVEAPLMPVYMRLGEGFLSWAGIRR